MERRQRQNLVIFKLLIKSLLRYTGDIKEKKNVLLFYLITERDVIFSYLFICHRVVVDQSLLVMGYTCQ